MNWKLCIPAVVTLLFFSGCAKQENIKQLVGLGDDDETTYSGPTYPPTTKIAIAFTPGQVGQSCRVFAQSLIELPAEINGKEIENIILAEAGKHGADQVLIGSSRQAEDDNGPNFHYYGPASEYLCTDQCGGWKYGFEFWQAQGEWVSLGYSEWGNAKVRFENPLVTQVLMLRCR